MFPPSADRTIDDGLIPDQAGVMNSGAAEDGGGGVCVVAGEPLPG